MTPKEKARELVGIYAKKSNNLKQRTDWNYDKQCALIAVNEILFMLIGDNLVISYWQEVKEEIEKL